MTNRNIWTYDIETFLQCFTYTAKNVDTKEVVQFSINKYLNHLPELITHLRLVRGHIGFNCLNFDYPVLHFIIKNANWLMGRSDLAEIIHSHAQKIITNLRNKEFTSIRKEDVLIPQLDLFKIWHFDNPSKSTSLKSLQVFMGWKNVMSMPFPHDKINLTRHECLEILKYNLNDVESTEEFYFRSKEKIEIRKYFKKEFGLDCINYSDSTLGERLVFYLYNQKKKLSEKDCPKNYNAVGLKDVILNKISFETEAFNKILSFFNSKKAFPNQKTNNKDKEERTLLFNNVEYSFGLGGIHGANNSGVYKTEEDSIIYDIDVTGLYPSICETNRLFPRHLGELFVDILSDIKKKRNKAKKDNIMPLSDGLKLSLNSVIGKSKSIHSFLYDPKFFYSITINGQLFLAMLAEKLSTKLKSAVLIQINTDGITIKINKSEEKEFREICSWWENIVGLDLEYETFEKIVMRDVNNYCAITTSGKIKQKGCFEVHKKVGNEIAYWKDSSFRIIPIALEKYFFQNIPVSKTISEHSDIFAFYGREKFKEDSFGEVRNFNPKTLELLKTKTDKVTRYYVSEDGGSFHKVYPEKKKESCINKNYLISLANEHIDIPFESRKINYKFYINECNKIINDSENKCSNLTLDF